jgi:hypothetical protein
MSFVSSSLGGNTPLKYLEDLQRIGAIANLFRAPLDSRRGEMSNVLIHQSLSISGHTCPPIGPIFVKLLR